jgi:hypothetical protein
LARSSSRSKRFGRQCARQSWKLIQQIDEQLLQAPLSEPIKVKFEERRIALVRVEDRVNLLALAVKTDDLRCWRRFGPE